MPETKHLQHHINSGFIRVVTDTQSQIPAFWAHPTIGGPFPGLIVLHDDWGLGPATRTLAQRFAEVGYYVIVPELFDGHRANNQSEADRLEEKYKTLAPPKVAAGLGALETHPKCNSKLAVIGCDLGGALAMQLAFDRQDVMAAVTVSGDPTAFLGRFDQLRCPLLAIFGEDDEITQRTEHRLQAELNAADIRHQVIVYPKTPHTFYNHLTPTYQHEAAEDAWEKVLEFLEIHQGKPPAPADAAPGHFRPGRVY